MNKKRLLKLADLLEQDAKNKKGIKFDMRTWGMAVDEETVGHSCGTVACAMGLAVVSGIFKEDGLCNAYGEVHLGKTFATHIMPKFAGHTGFDAAALLFGIHIQDAHHLFSDGAYEGEVTGAKGERRVAERIRKFVERRKV